MAVVSACRSCGAEVVWLRHAVTGTLMPVDPDPRSDGNVARNGTTFRIVGAKEKYTGDLYRSHFVTCPDRAAWRNPRQ